VAIASASAHLGFYEAAAQVIPVLLLVMAFGESRLRVERPEEATYLDAYAVLLGFLILVVGEVAALRVLLTGNDDGGLHFMAASGVAYGLAFIVSRFALQTLGDLRKQEDAPEDSVHWESSFVVFLAGVVFVGVSLMLNP
jgi:hypothetical protein